MVNKRGQNEGSIYKRENGSWRAQISLHGKRLSYTGKTKRECLDWIRKTKSQIDLGLTFNSSQLTLKKYMNDWLVNIEASIRPNTFKQYQHLTHKRILPFLGRYKLINLRPDIIQNRYNQMIEEGYGLRTIQITHSVLHRALVQAVKLGLIFRNPDDATSPPKPQKAEMQFYDKEQVQQFLIHTKLSKDRYYPLYHLAISTGMRQGELLALKWSDLDMDQRTLKVQRQFTRAKNGGFELTQPKTQAGRRTIALGFNTLEMLKEHQRDQFQVKLDVGDKWKDLDFIFTTKLGTPFDKYSLLKSFKKASREAGLPVIRFHDLRHTAATLQLNNGVPVILVSNRLGHSKPSVTLDVYGHLIAEKQHEAADLMDEIITPISMKILI